MESPCRSRWGWSCRPGGGFSGGAGGLGNCHPWGAELEQCWSSSWMIGLVLRSCAWRAAAHGKHTWKQFGKDGRDPWSRSREWPHHQVLFVTQHGAQGLRAHQGLLYSLDSVQGVIQTFSRRNSSQLSQAPLLRILPNKLPREEAKQRVSCFYFLNGICLHVTEIGNKKHHKFLEAVEERKEVAAV